MSTHQKVKAYGITKIKILDTAMFICPENVLCVLHHYKPGSEHQMAHTEILNVFMAKNTQHCSDTEVIPSKQHRTHIQQHKTNGNKPARKKNFNTLAAVKFLSLEENSGIEEMAQSI